MRSLLLLLTFFPLASFPLAFNRVNYEVEDFTNENGTGSDVYWLQDRYEGDTFFKYAGAHSFLPPRAELVAANGISSPVLIQPMETWLTRQGKIPKI